MDVLTYISLKNKLKKKKRVGDVSGLLGEKHYPFFVDCSR